VCLTYVGLFRCTLQQLPQRVVHLRVRRVRVDVHLRTRCIVGGKAEFRIAQKAKKSLNSPSDGGKRHTDDACSWLSPAIQTGMMQSCPSHLNDAPIILELHLHHRGVRRALRDPVGVCVLRAPNTVPETPPFWGARDQVGKEEATHTRENAVRGPSPRAGSCVSPETVERVCREIVAQPAMESFPPEHKQVGKDKSGKTKNEALPVRLLLVSCVCRRLGFCFLFFQKKVKSGLIQSIRTRDSSGVFLLPASTTIASP
jgi:hypothetical protein